MVQEIRSLQLKTSHFFHVGGGGGGGGACTRYFTVYILVIRLLKVLPKSEPLICNVWNYLISYGMARLCFVISQPPQFLLRLRFDRCTKKVVTLTLNISGYNYGYGDA